MLRIAEFLATLRIIPTAPAQARRGAGIFYFSLLLLMALGQCALQAAEGRLVRVTAARNGECTELWVENLQTAEVTVTLEMELDNFQSSRGLPFAATLPPRSRLRAVALQPKDPARESNWSYTYHATWGGMHAVHDETATYQLPFPPGQGFAVSQGFHGAYSHVGGDAYAIDFKMPPGTPVHASREGTVVGVKDDSSRGGPDKSYEWDANYILIQHADGTLGHYVHLQKGGARVRVGDKVEAGQWIGHSGNTGHSTGPHLHFAVFKARSGRQRETIPVKFRTAPLLAEVLSEGRSYTAF